MAPPTITNTPIVDDDGSLTRGSVWNNPWQLSFEVNINALAATLDAGGTGLAAETAARVALSPGETRPVTVGVITAEPIPTGTGDLVSYHNNATLKTIQGMVAGLPDQRWTHFSIGAGQVDFAPQNAGAAAALRLINFAGSTGTLASTSLAAGVGMASFRYDATAARWRMETHEQGDWITPAYNAGNFTASGSMTWTVDAGDVSNLKYWLRGRELTISFSFDTTSVGGTPSTDLKIGSGGFGGFTIVGQWNTALALASDAGSLVTAGSMLQAQATGNALRLLKPGFANWSAATNTTAVYGQVAVGVA